MTEATDWMPVATTCQRQSTLWPPPLQSANAVFIRCPSFSEIFRIPQTSSTILKHPQTMNTYLSYVELLKTPTPSVISKSLRSLLGRAHWVFGCFR